MNRHRHYGHEQVRHAPTPSSRRGVAGWVLLTALIYHSNSHAKPLGSPLKAESTTALVVVASPPLDLGSPPAGRQRRRGFELANASSVSTRDTHALDARSTRPAARTRTSRRAKQRPQGTENWKRRSLTLVRLWPREARTIRLYDQRGRLRRHARRVLRRLFRPKTGATRKTPHPRLIRLLTRVSAHFDGKPIHLVSGVRTAGGNTKPTSRHVHARAVDFRIPGVELTTLRDYCLTLTRVGVGYYPDSDFVHLDVRERSYRWAEQD